MPQEKQRKLVDRLAVLDYIERYKRTTGRSPSQRCIARALQLSSATRSNYAIKQLRRAGLVDVQVIERAHPLEIVITETGTKELQHWRARQQTLARSGRGAA